MRSVIVPFFNYGHGNTDLLFKLFKVHAEKWLKYVDRLYIIDSGCGLSWDDPKVSIIQKPVQSHWQNMNEALRETNEEEILLLDSDMVIYNPDVIKDNFEKLKEYDVVAILDSSGSKPIKSDQFAENENRFERRRICPYLCFLRRSALRSFYDFTPRGGTDWTDSMGTITEDMVTDGKKILELPDDRSTITLEDDGRITSCQWLDVPPKKWSLIENPGYGYYHIRNFGGGLKILKEGDFNGVPGREARRLLAWVLVAAEKTHTRLHSGSDLVFESYKNKFYEYYPWLKDL